jgi:methylamine dehydrogenase accessory protein MauD
MPDLWMWSYLVLWALVLILALLLMGLIRQVGLLQIRLSGGADRKHGVGTGENAVAKFDANTLDGEHVSAESLRGRPALLFFTGDACSTCRRILPAFSEITERRGPTLRTMIMARGSLAETRAWADSLNVRSQVVADEDGAVAEAFGVSTTPQVLLLDETGKVHARVVPNEAGDVFDMVAGHKSLLDRFDLVPAPSAA